MKQYEYRKYWGNVPYDNDACKKTLNEFVSESPYHSSSKDMMRFGNANISYEAFQQELERTSAAFFNLGVKENEIVFMFLLNTPQTVVTMYAINNIGAISEWYNASGMTVELMRHDLMENHIRFMVICDVIYPLVKQAIPGTDVEKVIVVPVKGIFNGESQDEYFISWDTFIQQFGIGKTYNKAEYADGKTTLIVHTGGTSGVVKRIAMSDYNINSFVYKASLMPFNFQPDDSFCQLIPPMVAWSLAGIHLSRFYNMLMYLIPTYDKDQFVDIMLSTRANHYFTVPAFVKTLIGNPKLENRNLSFLKSINHGGESLSPEDDRRIDDELLKHGATIKNRLGFGQNEEFACFTANLDIPGCPKEYGCCGIPLIGNDYLIIDPRTQKVLPIGMNQNGTYNIGELHITGDTVMSGYYGKDAALNSQVFRMIDNKRFFNTGDQAYIDENGKLWFATRDSRIIRKRNGGKVFANVLEEIINGIPYVKESCVVAAPNGKDKDTSCHMVLHESIYDLPKEDQDIIIEKIIAQIEEQCRSLYTYYMPDTYKFHKQGFSLTSFGKVDYKLLEAENVKEVTAYGGKLPKIRY